MWEKRNNFRREKSKTLFSLAVFQIIKISVSANSIRSKAITYPDEITKLGMIYTSSAAKALSRSDGLSRNKNPSHEEIVVVIQKIILEKSVTVGNGREVVDNIPS